MARTYDHTLALMTSTIAAGLASRIERSLPYSKEARTRIIDEAYEMAHEIRELCIDWEGHENGE